MTAVPQDDRSPIRQSRWIRAKNTGASEIPAHGVCEVDTNTCGTDFTETLNVKRPTAAGLPEVVVNSPVPISVGGYGWVTNDFPTYALGSASFTNGDMVGTAANSYTLSLGKPGFMVLGDGPSAGILRVKELWEPLIRGTLGADLCPADLTATVASSYVSRNSLLITSADNIYSLAGQNGSDIALQWDGVLEKWVVLQVKHRVQSVLTDIAKASCAITKTYIAQVALMYCGSPTTTTAVQLYAKTFLTAMQVSDAISGSGASPTGSCRIQTNSMTVCVFDDASSNGLTTAITFEPVVVMQTVRQNGLCLEGYVTVVYVPCSGDGAYVNLLCGTDCTSTGSS